MERIEGDMRAMMGLFQTFIGSPQMSSVSIGSIYLVDATHKKHPVPMNMASSFDVRFFDVSPEIILTIIFSNLMILFEHCFNQAVFKARDYDDM